MKYVDADSIAENLQDNAHDLLSYKYYYACRCPLVARCMRLAGVKYKYCVACGTSGKADDKDKFRHCQQYECNGQYISR